MIPWQLSCCDHPRLSVVHPLSQVSVVGDISSQKGSVVCAVGMSYQGGEVKSESFMAFLLQA